MSYIYPIPSAQVNCNGSVSSVEFSYTVHSIDTNSTEYKVFTLSTLYQNGSIYTVTNSIPIQSRPSSDICTGIGSPQYCCDIARLNDTDKFKIPTSNFAFGISIPPLGSSEVRLRKFTGYSVELQKTVVVLEEGTIHNFITESNGTLLAVRFHISE